ncbi:hypothetical protein Aca07nite_78750 [Actinoplanes capillaceus]|uniref:Uncharacterized protein n=2 Tax=Actinoplanes campanulatus TaxID=113559 RepID=A0ABQ3WWG3_9ACTN|nr:hypothetical protein Aca07nite_78750 [Actinoplanes capillaceus]
MPSAPFSGRQSRYCHPEVPIHSMPSPYPGNFRLMTDTPDEQRTDEPEEPSGDYEYDEAHGGGDSGPDVPAALREEAQQRVSLAGRTAPR